MDKDAKTEIVTVTPTGGEATTVRVRSSDSRTAEKMRQLFKEAGMAPEVRVPVPEPEREQ